MLAISAKPTLYQYHYPTMHNDDRSIEHTIGDHEHSTGCNNKLPYTSSFTTVAESGDNVSARTRLMKTHSWLRSIGDEHHSKFPRATQDNGVTCDAEKAELSS